MRADVTLKGSYEALLAEVQTAASRLKTGALKAAYTEVIDKWIDGKGQESLQRKLDVAFKEKTRYHANRIAQTELARAHQDKVGAEFMQDDTITVVQVVMAPKHPVFDVCDYHSSVNLFGLGKGCYPKAKAPKPTFHPHCRCILRSRPDLSAVNAREVPGGEAAYLRSLPVGDAARIVGSKDRLQKVLNGTPLDDVINAGINPEYHLKRLGQVDLPVVHPARVPLVVGIDNSVMPTKKTLTSDSEIMAFVNGDGNEPIAIAFVPKDIQDILSAQAELVLLSRYTVEKQQRHHPEITPEKYLWIQDLIDKGDRLRGKEKHIVVLQHRESPYVAVFKATNDGMEVFLQSFRRTDAKDIANLRRRDARNG